MRVEVVIGLKEGVLDPQGKAIGHALNALGYEGVSDVKVGKVITFELDGHDVNALKKEAESMCEVLLANTVIETYRVKIV